MKVLVRSRRAPLAAFLLGLGLGTCGGGRGLLSPAPAPREESYPTPEVVLAAPGRVEGQHDVVAVNAGVDGVLATILVQEGQAVAAGDVLATVDRHDLARDLAAARAELESLRQTRIRLLRGARTEARERAAEETAASAAALARVRSRYDRLRPLGDQGVIAAEALEEARRDFEIAEALARAAARGEDLIGAPPLPEEVAKADADVRAAEERVRAADARLGKCTVRAPISGTVLKKYLEAGEAVSTTLPQPILLLGDTSRLRVRAEVDERDVGRVRSGQAVIVRAEAFGEGGYRARVSWVATVMGRKDVRTGDPAEKSDRDVLEVLADLEEGAGELVVGLRVTVQFLKEGGQGHGG
jgi:HlyD family secretion protein